LLTYTTVSAPTCFGNGVLDIFEPHVRIQSHVCRQVAALFDACRPGIVCGKCHQCFVEWVHSIVLEVIIKLDSEEKLLCRVTSLGTSFMGKTQVAVEFIMPTPGFWDKQ